MGQELRDTTMEVCDHVTGLHVSWGDRPLDFNPDSSTPNQVQKLRAWASSNSHLVTFKVTAQILPPWACIALSELCNTCQKQTQGWDFFGLIVSESSGHRGGEDTEERTLSCPWHAEKGNTTALHWLSCPLLLHPGATLIQR